MAIGGGVVIEREDRDAPMRVVDVSLSAIHDSAVQDRDLGDISALAASIKSVGLQQPVGLLDLGDGMYDIVWGHRRVAALRLLCDSDPCRSSYVPARVFDNAVCSRADVERLRLTENVMRKDLSPREEAFACLAAVTAAPGGSDIAVATETGLNIAYLRRRARVALRLSPGLWREVDYGDLPIEAAEIVCRLADHVEQEVLVERVNDLLHPQDPAQHLRLMEGLRYKIASTSYQITQAPFDPAGCGCCPHRTDVQDSLDFFTDTAEIDSKASKIARCLGTRCWMDKALAAALVQKTALEARGLKCFAVKEAVPDDGDERYECWHSQRDPLKRLTDCGTFVCLDWVKKPALRKALDASCRGPRVIEVGVGRVYIGFKSTDARLAAFEAARAAKKGKATAETTDTAAETTDTAAETTDAAGETTDPTIDPYYQGLVRKREGELVDAHLTAWAGPDNTGTELGALRMACYWIACTAGVRKMPGTPEALRLVLDYMGGDTTEADTDSEDDDFSRHGLLRAALFTTQASGSVKRLTALLGMLACLALDRNREHGEPIHDLVFNEVVTSMTAQVSIEVEATAATDARMAKRLANLAKEANK